LTGSHASARRCSSRLATVPTTTLIADLGEGLLRVQVKTSTQVHVTPSGYSRCPVMLATNGGNQSWSKITKRFDPSRFDYLFAVTGDGRRWFVPSHAIESSNVITLGGPKYSEFEIEPALPIRPLVYANDDGASIESSSGGGVSKRSKDGGCKPSGLVPSQVRILPPPSPHRRPAHERQLGRSGQAIIYPKRRLTIPLQPFTDAGLGIGDRLRARSDGTGRVVLTRIDGQNDDGPP
jgi:hypothetical protein